MLPSFNSVVLLILSAATASFPVLARCSETTSTTKYPNQQQIAQVFKPFTEGKVPTFLANSVSPDVSWTVMGTHPLAGRYHNSTIVAYDALARLAETLDPAHPVTQNLTSIIGGGDSEWSVQELHGQGVCKNGLIYNIKEAWVTRWNTEGLIVEIRSYTDSALIYRAITENESGEYTYTDQRDTLVRGPAGLGCTNP